MISKETLFLTILPGIAVLAAFVGFIWWLGSGSWATLSTEHSCLRAWHTYTISEEIGDVDQWLGLENCIKQHPKYQELYKKYALPKLKKS